MARGGEFWMMKSVCDWRGMKELGLLMTRMKYCWNENPSVGVVSWE